MESVSELARWCCWKWEASWLACGWLSPLCDWPRYNSASLSSGDSGICPRLWWERLIARGLERTVEAAGLNPGKWSSSWTNTEPDSALLRAASEYEILFSWSGLERVDKLGARLPELSLIPTASPLRESREYCKLFSGEREHERHKSLSFYSNNNNH